MSSAKIGPYGRVYYLANFVDRWGVPRTNEPGRLMLEPPLLAGCSHRWAANSALRIAARQKALHELESRGYSDIRVLRVEFGVENA